MRRFFGAIGKVGRGEQVERGMTESRSYVCGAKLRPGCVEDACEDAIQQLVRSGFASL